MLQSTVFSEGFEMRQMSEVEDVTDKVQQLFLNKELRLCDRYELQEELGHTLEDTEHHRHLASKLAKCSHTFRQWGCAEGHRWVAPENACSLRICPHCSHKRSAEVAGRIEPYVSEHLPRLRYVVLSEPNCKSLREGQESLRKSWTALRRSVCWKRHVVGCITVEEVTYNPKTRTWHPHLNVLMEGEYFPHEELRQAWKKATKGRSRQVFISAADPGTVRELIKYVTKIADFIGRPEVLDEFLTAIEGRRLIRTYGTFRGLAVEEDELEGRETNCPDCQALGLKHTPVVRLSIVPAWQLSFDFERQTFRRVARAPDGDEDESTDFSPDFLAMNRVLGMLRRVRQSEGRDAVAFARSRAQLKRVA